MYLLDTNVVSELRKVKSGRADLNVAHWARRVLTTELYLSVITVQELELGILLTERRDAQQGRALHTWLDRQVLPAFAGRLLPVTVPIARQSAALNSPDPRPERDRLIAATALVHGLTMVTRSVRDFQGTGLSVLDPGQPPADD
ncbi:type II toxin-antitoxin system VapC family toxin [Deinococcus radiotolerans]|uniref:Twitching motility protein PilT n=1 Tax=Deinococcus radiotolerans TaxID=1309407 RepID=A0ABQ2FLT3_9DEIO|nr:type II toxin-antitoxin system VapC family toxin [Deinococcus radiotolerans]GGL08008.1 twitching motility protein PilT [Deinococcus radiotolerans]